MDAVKAFKTYGIMCKFYDGDCREECPLSYKNNKRGVVCSELIVNYADEAVEIVEKWDKENSFITNRLKFEEVFCKAVPPLWDCAWWDEPYIEPESEKK